jgi:hypothetical protein
MGVAERAALAQGPPSSHYGRRNDRARAWGGGRWGRNDEPGVIESVEWIEPIDSADYSGARRSIYRKPPVLDDGANIRRPARPLLAALLAGQVLGASAETPSRR